MMLFSQSYNSVAGLRFGNEFGFSFVQRLANHTTVEAVASDGLFSDYKYFSLGLRQHHKLITKRFNIYIGGGYYGKTSSYHKKEEEDFKFSNQGVMGLMGFEMTIHRLNISIDYIPRYMLTKTSSEPKLSADSAISLRYVFWKRTSATKKFLKKIF